MGGHQSRQNVNVSAKTVANVVQSTAQDCINVEYGGNTISIDGNYDDISGVAQTVQVSMNSDCGTLTGQTGTFDNKFASAVSQVLKEQEVALTQWMDNSKTNTNSAISQKLSSGFTQKTVQSCVNNTNNFNILSVQGNADVVQNITQNSTMNTLSQCLMQNGQTSDVVSDFTNIVNQHSEYDSENPLAFIGDAFAAIAKSAMLIAAIAFIVIVCFVMLLVLLRRRRRGRDTAPAPAPIIIETGPSMRAPIAAAAAPAAVPG